MCYVCSIIIYVIYYILKMFYTKEYFQFLLPFSFLTVPVLIDVKLHILEKIDIARMNGDT